MICTDLQNHFCGGGKLTYLQQLVFSVSSYFKSKLKYKTSCMGGVRRKALFLAGKDRTVERFGI
jgi:hypothetical protein